MDQSWFQHDPEQGMLVELHSLSKAELNGRLGECTAYVPSKERWAVQLLNADASPSQSIAVKPGNLRRAPPADAADLAFTAAEKAISILSNMRSEPSGRYSEADIERVHMLFDEAEKHDWANVSVHQGRGDLAMMRGDMAGAVVHFRRAVANGYNLKGADSTVVGGAPGEQQILRRVALANALGNLDDLDGESHQLRQVLAVNPGHVHARLSIGQNLRQRGKEDEAVPEFMMALQLPNEGPGRLADEVALSQIRRAAIQQLTSIFGKRANQLSRQRQHRASIEQLQKLAKILRESLSGPQYDDKNGDEVAPILTGNVEHTEWNESTTAVFFGAGGRQISQTEVLCQLVTDLARTESNMTADYLELGERSNAEDALARAEAALALHPTTKHDKKMQGRLKYERGKVKEHEGDEVTNAGGEGATERAAALYNEAKEIYRASHNLCPDVAAKEAFGRAQVKAHEDMEFVPGPGGGGVARVKPGRPGGVRLEQLP